MLVAGLRPHALLYALSAGAMIVAFAAAIYLNRPFDLTMVSLFTRPIVLLIVVAVLWVIARKTFYLWRSGYQGSAIKALGTMIVTDLLAPARLANVVHACITLCIFMSAFTSLKAFLPRLNPFRWGETFMEWDRIVHFGVHPYQILQPFLGFPWITLTLNFVYNFWFLVMFTIWIWQSFASEDSFLRQRFLVAFVITWFLGTNVLGTIFSSAGPAFYGRLHSGDDPFLPLMTYLRETSHVERLWALDTQDALWQAYVTGKGVINGISAMPSMHIGTCILLALTGFAAGKRWLGWCLVAFTAVIFLGSVHLAWHFAIDGYAGAAVAFFGWYVAGHLVRRDRAKQGLMNA